MTFASPVPLLPDATVLASRDLLFALPFGIAGLLALRFGLLRGAGRAVPSTRASAFRRAFEGGAVALALLAATVLPPFLAGAFRQGAPGWTAFSPGAPAPRLSAAPATLAFFATQALVEEMLFRAALMTLAAALVLGALRLLFGPLPPRADAAGLPRFSRRWFAAGLFANVVQAVSFALLHAHNPHVTALGIVNIGLAGAVLGSLFWNGGGLAGAWAFHALWNWGLSALALPVSGMALATPLVATGITGAAWPLLSGGSFGPEGSLVDTVALAVVLAVLVARSARSSWSAAGSERVGSGA